MLLPADELLRHARAFNAAGMEFMVVGAVAVAIHGAPRTTADLDLVVHLPLERKAEVERVLRGMGHANVEERRDDFGFRYAAASSSTSGASPFPSSARRTSCSGSWSTTASAGGSTIRTS